MAVVVASDADKFKKLAESENPEATTGGLLLQKKAYLTMNFQRSADCKYFQRILDTNGGERKDAVVEGARRSDKEIRDFV